MKLKVLVAFLCLMTLTSKVKVTCSDDPNLQAILQQMATKIATLESAQAASDAKIANLTSSFNALQSQVGPAGRGLEKFYILYLSSFFLVNKVFFARLINLCSF